MIAPHHYTLPEGNVVIAFSGGRTSAYMLHQILEANGGLPDRVVVSFQNTGREMNETLDFVQECGSRWGVNIVWLEYRPDAPRFEVVSHNSASRNGEPFEAVIRQRGFLPNRVNRYCTFELKVHTSRRYLVSLGWKNWVTATGIRADEPNRHLPHLARVKGTRQFTWQPLVSAGVSRGDVALFWKAQPFDLRLPNVNGNCWTGNCDGCFLKSEAHQAALAREYPERHAWWEAQEAIVAASGRATRSGSRFREEWTKRELREFIDRQGDWIFDTEGALCQASDGECT